MVQFGSKMDKNPVPGGSGDVIESQVRAKMAARTSHMPKRHRKFTQNAAQQAKTVQKSIKSWYKHLLKFCLHFWSNVAHKTDPKPIQQL